MADVNATRRRTLERVISEHKANGKLDLPRRPCLSGWKTSSRDLTERRASDDVARRTKVRVIEQVEDVGAELQPRVSNRTDVLDHRQVHVVESRPDHNVTAEIAETVDGDEHGRIEPLIDGTDDVNRARGIRPYGIGRPVDAARGRHDVDGISTLTLRDDGQLPPARQHVAGERQ